MYKGVDGGLFRARGVPRGGLDGQGHVERSWGGVDGGGMFGRRDRGLG